MKLTIEEKSIVSRYISEDMSIKGALKAYWPWLLPVVGAAIYGIATKDFISCSIANVLFLFYAYWFLDRGSLDGRNLKSALKKYEAEVSALGD